VAAWIAAAMPGARLVRRRSMRSRAVWNFGWSVERSRVSREIWWARQRSSSDMPGLCQSSNRALMRSRVISGWAGVSMGARYGGRVGVQGESGACTGSCAQMRYMRARKSFGARAWDGLGGERRGRRERRGGGEVRGNYHRRHRGHRGHRGGMGWGGLVSLCFALSACSVFSAFTVFGSSFAPPGRGDRLELVSTGCASLRPWLQAFAPLGREEPHDFVVGVTEGGSIGRMCGPALALGAGWDCRVRAPTSPLRHAARATSPVGDGGGVRAAWAKARGSLWAGRSGRRVAIVRAWVGAGGGRYDPAL
jgi:hypothetical protein